MELEVVPAERRGLGPAQQAFPHRRLGLGLLAPALALVDPLDPRRGLDRGQGASLISPLACLRGLPCSLTSRFTVALTSGRVVGSSCPPSRCSAAIAVRRSRTVASVQTSTVHKVPDVAADVRRSYGSPVHRGSIHQLVRGFQPAT